MGSTKPSTNNGSRTPPPASVWDRICANVVPIVSVLVIGGLAINYWEKIFPIDPKDPNPVHCEGRYECDAATGINNWITTTDPNATGDTCQVVKNRTEEPRCVKIP